MKLWLVYEEGYSDSDGAVRVDSVWESEEGARHRVDQDTRWVDAHLVDNSADPTYKPHLPIGTEARARYFKEKRATTTSRLRIKEIETATRLDWDE